MSELQKEEGIDLKAAMEEIINTAIHVFEDEEDASTTHVFGLLLVTATAWASQKLQESSEHREAMANIFKETAENIMRNPPWELIDE